MKIDVEGHEFDVLMDLRYLEITKLIQFEFGGKHTQELFFKIFAFLKTRGFHFTELHQQEFKNKKILEQDELFRTTNYIALNNKLI